MSKYSSPSKVNAPAACGNATEAAATPAAASTCTALGAVTNATGDNATRAATPRKTRAILRAMIARCEPQQQRCVCPTDN
mmetsp:Transcript_5523/g.12127  ORF Transcript_5523/g.12127 Transcript_5523/m.12127 type:complete len:80 (-) Transcript_5523:22-261(-)